jgi:lauroyl/myristoyl acyltransferase
LLASPHPSGAVERFFRARRARWGVAALECAPGWIEAATALRGGEWLALMTDRATPGLRGSLWAWAATLARRTGAIVLPVAMTRVRDGRQAMWCDAPLEPGRGLETALGTAVRRQLERAAEQWFAFAALPEGLA